MSGKKDNSSGSNLGHDLLVACAAWGGIGIVTLIEKEAEYHEGLEGALLMLLCIAICIGILAVVLPVAFRGLPEALERKRMRKQRFSGGSFSQEALDYFESNPCESYYTDSRGGSWDNVYLDDF